MRGKPLEEWQRLCEQAASEQDPVRLVELVERINHLLRDKQEKSAEFHKDQGERAA